MPSIILPSSSSGYEHANVPSLARGDGAANTSSVGMFGEKRTVRPSTVPPIQRAPSGSPTRRSVPGPRRVSSRRSRCVSSTASSRKRATWRPQPPGASSGPDPGEGEQVTLERRDRLGDRQLGKDAGRPARSRVADDAEAGVAVRRGAQHPHALGAQRRRALGRHVRHQVGLVRSDHHRDTGVDRQQVARTPVEPAGLLAERVERGVQRAHALDAQVARQHVAVAAAGAVAGLGERDQQVAVLGIAVDREQVAVAEHERVEHHGVRVTLQGVGMHPLRSAGGVARRPGRGAAPTRIAAVHLELRAADHHVDVDPARVGPLGTGVAGEVEAAAERHVARRVLVEQGRPVAAVRSADARHPVHERDLAEPAGAAVARHVRLQERGVLGARRLDPHEPAAAELPADARRASGPRDRAAASTRTSPRSRAATGS